MNTFILSKSQVQQVVTENLYEVDEKSRLISRCIDGRYNNSGILAPLAFPGADMGDLAVLLSASNSFGFEIDPNKALESFIKVIGGEKNFQFHTDHHGDKVIPASGCGHFKQMNLDPEAYAMKKEHLEFIAKHLKILKEKGANEVVLEGDHNEGAVIMVKGGNFSIKTRSFVENGYGKRDVEVFIYHVTLSDIRHRLLAKQLIEDKAVTMLDSQGEEYLYDALSDTAENHLMETAKRLAKGLPIFEVVFHDSGKFVINDLGIVST